MTQPLDNTRSKPHNETAEQYRNIKLVGGIFDGRVTPYFRCHPVRKVHVEMDIVDGSVTSQSYKLDDKNPKQALKCSIDGTVENPNTGGTDGLQ